MLGVCLYLFFATAIGIFLATVARTMPQLGLLYMLVAMPMNILSGSNTCRMGARIETDAARADPGTHREQALRRFLRLRLILRRKMAPAPAEIYTQ
jgi:hypothetical protein